MRLLMILIRDVSRAFIRCARASKPRTTISAIAKNFSRTRTWRGTSRAAGQS